MKTKPMTDRKAAEILARFNRWRRGEDPFDFGGEPVPETPQDIGIAIDVAVKQLKQKPCKSHDECMSALRIIHTWSTYRNGEELDCREVAKLCEKTLSKTK